MSTREDIIRRLRSLIEVNLETSVKETLLESDRLSEDLNVDSIMTLQLIVYLEEEFGIFVPEDDVNPDTFKTIGSMADWIESLASSKV